MGGADHPLRPRRLGPPYAAVAFDCDSTLSAVEGIDELARLAGVHGEISRMTAAAMEGRMPLEDVYGARLGLIRPDAEAIGRLSQLYVERVVPGAEEAVRTLAALGKSVFVVSGGIRQAVAALARHLGVPDDHVRAVDVAHDETGAYAGFDADSPLARSGGKIEVLAEITAAKGPSVLVGDGITDLEVTEGGGDFVGFGGVVERPAVRERAPVYVTGPDLTAVLPWLLTASERISAGRT